MNKRREQHQKWVDENPVAYRVARLKGRLKKYGLEPEQFALIAVMQDFRCAVCRRPPAAATTHQHRLHVDHDHKTGKVRGLLCMNCNLALGAVHDDPQILAAMAEYLERS